MNRVVSSCFYQLRRIKSSLKALPLETAKTLVNCFVVSRLDYCNSLLAAGMPWGLNFNAHPHPIPTEKPVGIPTESPYPQNPEILHNRTIHPHPVYFCLMHISFYFLSCMPSVCSIIVCTQYCTAWCMNIITQYIQIKLSLTVAYARIGVATPEPFFNAGIQDWEIYNPGIQGSRRDYRQVVIISRIMIVNIYT